MRQLPCAGDTQDGELDERPAHDAGVGGFGLIAELGLTLLSSVLASIDSHYFHFSRGPRAKGQNVHAETAARA